MKKISRIIALIVLATSMSLVPVAVSAQGADPIPVDTGAPAATELPSTGGSEVKAPNTGIAPNSKVAQNAVIFTVGSALGAAVGLGVITIRKKKFNS